MKKILLMVIIAGAVGFFLRQYEPAAPGAKNRIPEAAPYTASEGTKTQPGVSSENSVGAAGAEPEGDVTRVSGTAAPSGEAAGEEKKAEGFLSGFLTSVSKTVKSFWTENKSEVAGPSEKNRPTASAAVTDDKGKYDETSGLYINETYGFKITVPPSWRRFTVKEAITCSISRDKYADYYFLISSPAESMKTVIIINKLYPSDGMSEEQLKTSATYNHSDASTEIRYVNGIPVARAGYMIGDVYRENYHFISNKELIEIYLLVEKSDNSDYILNQMRSVIESSLSKC